MEEKMKIVIVAIVTLAVMSVIGYALITSAFYTAEENQEVNEKLVKEKTDELRGETNELSELDALATCLTEKGFKMAGAEWCSACKSQKQIFGESFALVDYQDCDKEKDFCLNAQIEYYPTWVSPDGTKTVGVQTPAKLKALAGCEA